MKLPDLADRGPRRTIASSDSYEEVQAIVDHLADDGFPVEHVAIVGRDLQYVEQVTGHLNAWKAALGGAGSGATLGFLFGLLFGVWFAHDGTSLLAIVVYWALFGALFGAVLALVGHLMNRGRRNFASIASVQPRRFDVLVDATYADEAERRLGAAGVRAP